MKELEYDVAVEMLDRINAIDGRIENYSKTPNLGLGEMDRRLGVIAGRLAAIGLTNAEIAVAIKELSDVLLDA